jgi:EAL domain-containing protein (putative c-di-GMP-specific phosphodiesterase class I)/GGDEF domain-containing protein
MALAKSSVAVAECIDSTSEIGRRTRAAMGGRDSSHSDGKAVLLEYFGRREDTSGVEVGAVRDGSSSGNHRSASVRFVEQFLKQGQQGRLAGLLLGELDAFNRIATTFGHDRCEAFCAGYADKLRDTLPPRTPVIRLSERRFAILLDVDSMSAVMDAAILLTEDNPPQIEEAGDRFLVDVTLGIAVYPSHADDAATLFRRAELALKGARDNELAFDVYRPDATQQQAALWKFESELKNAVQQNELDVYFQPKVEIARNSICGVEALVRWRTRSGRFMPASDFIPLAERAGSIVPITWIVFDRVAERIEDWSSLPRPFSIAVNLSPQVLAVDDFLPRLRSLKASLDEHRFDLTLELTEDSLLHSDVSSLLCMDRVRKLGVDLSIDDFGKGYSSLSYLKQIPATEIKIDKRFIGAIAVDEKDQQIVKTVISLAHALGMRVVAEGVDSAEALASVKELGCEIAQGYYIGRPMRSDLVTEWLARYAANATSTQTSRAFAGR